MKFFANLFPIFRRELAAYFNAAIAYIFIIVFVVLNGGLYMTQFFVVGSADMRPLFMTLPFLLSVFLPAVTMRLWAEERRGNTLELLLTFPMGTHELVIGKFLAALVFYSAALAGTLTIPIMLRVLGHPDMGMIVGGYAGAFLMGAFFLAIGIFVSGLCRDQIVAFILAMMICFGLHLLGTQFMASSIDGWLPGFGSLLSQTIGSAAHFESFAKGVLDGRDVFYYLVGTVIFLALNGFWLEGRMRVGAKKIFTTAVVISAGIFLMANWLFGNASFGRIDLTEGKIYTISPATKKILRELKAPVTAKFYISSADKMPTGMKTLEQDVSSKLDEFKVASKGKFQYKLFHMDASNVTDPGKKDKEESLEEQLEKKGVQPFQIRAIESDEVAVRLIYSAIGLAYKEKAEEIIPRVTPDNFNELEYTLVSKIYRMTLPETPRVTMVAPFSEKAVEPAVKALMAQLGGQVPEGYKEDNYELLPMALQYEGYEIARVKLNEKEPIPEGTKTLIVLEPKALNERQLYEINRFVRGGGSLLLAVQKYDYQYAASQRNVEITSVDNNPQINPLISTWGLEVDDRILVDQQHDVINLSGAARMGPFEVTVPVKIPIQILVTQTGMNPDMSITSRLSPIFYLWGTALKVDEPKIKAQGLKVETLLVSSSDSWTVPFRQGAIMPEHLARLPESSVGPLPLALFAQGQFADAYEGKSVPAWPADQEDKSKGQETAPAAVTPQPGKVILIGAATPFQKSLFKSGGHLNLFLNMVDALTLGDELITIRSKQSIDRVLGKISAPAKIGWRFFVTFLIPALIAGIGAFRVFFRRQAKANYLKQLVSQGE